MLDRSAGAKLLLSLLLLLLVKTMAAHVSLLEHFMWVPCQAASTFLCIVEVVALALLIAEFSDKMVSVRPSL